MTGKKFLHYRILDLLGSGGMGTVYKAFDLKLERFVAIKFLSNSRTNNFDLMDRFRNEAKKQAKLNHPNIVAIYGYEELNDISAIIMEYFSGYSLDNLIVRKKVLSLSESVAIIKQVLFGLSFAHKHGLIHRDIKPPNILINMSGMVKLVDFGVSSSLYMDETDSKKYSGTLIYLSPEQIEGKPASIRSDIYSVGLTVFEMICGSPLMQVRNNYEIINKELNDRIRSQNLKSASIPPAIRGIISKAISGNPDHRYASCDEFLAELSKLPLREISGEDHRRESVIKKIFSSIFEAN